MSFFVSLAFRSYNTKMLSSCRVWPYSLLYGLKPAPPNPPSFLNFFSEIGTCFSAMGHLGICKISCGPYSCQHKNQSAVGFLNFKSLGWVKPSGFIGLMWNTSLLFSTSGSLPQDLFIWAVFFIPNHADFHGNQTQKLIGKMKKWKASFFFCAKGMPTHTVFSECIYPMSFLRALCTSGFQNFCPQLNVPINSNLP